MYIPALDVVQGLPDVDIEEEMEDHAQMGHSVTRAKNAHLRDTVNQFRLSELGVAVFEEDTIDSRKGLGEFVQGTVFLRFGVDYELLVSSTPLDMGMSVSSFPSHSQGGEGGRDFHDETWEVLAETVEWSEADDGSEYPFGPTDFPKGDRYHAWMNLVTAAYGPNQLSAEGRVILELARYKAGNRDDAQLGDL